MQTPKEISQRERKEAKRLQRKADKSARSKRRQASLKAPKASSWGWKKHIAPTLVADDSARWRHLKDL
jgi:hypothetical protein